uniref:Zinc transporter ZupT n=1 Tax=Geobacter metallireducens TaxID=28232 RepID=A0A831U999_GEOME
MSNVWYALGLTLFAGLATGVGSAIAFFAKRTNYRFLSVSTGFSAGVMLYVSFVEILPKGFTSLAQAWGDRLGHWINTGSFFAGMLLIGLIDTLVPAASNPHETHSEEETAPLHDLSAAWPDFTSAAPRLRHRPPGTHDHRIDRHRLVRMGLFTALAIAIHNFPEGLATFLAALHDPRLGAAIALAVALHNIPEGISVSVPIYYATGDRRKAFGYSLLSGMAEPVGAGVAYLAIHLFLGGNGEVIPPQIMGLMFGAVAGIMVYISLDELLPTSKAYGTGHDSLLGLVSGMVVMALSLLLMQ